MQYELINEQGDIVAFGKYCELKLMAIVEKLSNYFITPAYVG